MLKTLISQFGRKELEVYEWDRNDILMKRLPDRPQWAHFANARPALEFSGWQLAQAVVKTDFLITKSRYLQSLGFLLQCHHVLNPNMGGNLRLVDGGSGLLSDVSQTSMSARLGQGISVLFAQNLGYDFVSHLATDPDVKVHKKTNKIGTVADFLFENSSRERMILEAKASFALQENNPSGVKQVLKPALEKQVAPWLSAISPPASKGYATLTCFREASSNTQSALVFVDPPGDETVTGMKLPPSWVLRRNYSSWLAAMGMIETAQQLIGADITESRSHDIDLATIRDRAFVVTRFHPEISEMEDIYVGIDLSIYSLIRDTINGSEDALLGYEQVEWEPDDFGQRPNGSLMSDGTFFGSIDEIQEIKSPKKHYT